MKFKTQMMFATATLLGTQFVKAEKLDFTYASNWTSSDWGAPSSETAANCNYATVLKQKEMMESTMTIPCALILRICWIDFIPR